MAWLGRYSTGDRVKDVQGLLWQAGVYDGEIDGYFGPVTEKAESPCISFVKPQKQGNEL